MTKPELLHFCADLGHGLMRSGAEIYRVEESIRRVLRAYGEPCGEVFAIPNCLIVSLDDGGTPMTRMRRAEPGGVDIELLESLNALCRRVCQETPEHGQARAWLQAAMQTQHKYASAVLLLGYMLCTCFFALYFGGSFADGAFAAIAAICIYASDCLMRSFSGGFFLRAAVGGILAGLVAQAAQLLFAGSHANLITIGAIMVLVPGMTMTSSVRDIMNGDTMSGISKLFEALLTAGAIALGVGASIGISTLLGFYQNITAPLVTLSVWQELLYAALACLGFCLLYNIHGVGLLLCPLGGAVAALVFSLMQGGILLQTLAAAVALSIYAELMARLRKAPVTGYQFIAMFPLLPGGGIYYTMQYAMEGELRLAAAAGVETLGIAAMISAGIILVSAVVRMLLRRRERQQLA